ncbi:DHA2 family efflux MFS transporter permease subunit [Agilicoccus flavus]|uniref:DHA2 family efflux MFS transporter permease subunit n=1 Tax=Agilicoccus flavus TaxID=2775968 RepID=UPI001CF6A14A|nr:DHA2 family efflux MFS transporter permease subunit [Agilicoccus flavus]
MSRSYTPRHAARPSTVGSTGTGAARTGAGAPDGSTDSAGPADAANPDSATAGGPIDERRAWRALWALLAGFFMILVDSTIVSVATPALMAELGADVNQVVWVTSAYLLAYAVPLLITGRLGDRFGQRTMYLTGLAVFTLASLACGLTHTIEWLIVARVVQGLGAAVMTPQTMALITRLFPPARRGTAMALWGATAGVATLVGPIAGGLLLDSLGWEWIFFVNVPVGLVGLALAWRLLPVLPTSRMRLDWLGVALSGLGLFLLVFGIQEGNTYEWGTIAGPISVWGLIVTGLLVLAAFVGWQHVNRTAPLVPLGLFADRNFAVANASIVVVGFTVTAMPFALMIFAQEARGYTPTQAALLTAPTAVMSIVLARWVGGLVNRLHPRLLATGGFVGWSISLFWLSRVMTTDSPVWALLLPMFLLGTANSFVWGPLSTSATANLPRDKAGAGAGVYNTTRQIGSVIGSAVVATVMGSRIAAHLPGASGAVAEGRTGSGSVPPAVTGALADAMSETILVPATVIGVATLLTLCLARPRHQLAVAAEVPGAAETAGAVDTPDAGPTTPAAGDPTNRPERHHA